MSPIELHVLNVWRPSYSRLVLHYLDSEIAVDGNKYTVAGLLTGLLKALQSLQVGYVLEHLIPDFLQHLLLAVRV